MESTSGDVLELHRVSKIYPGTPSVLALGSTTFAIERGSHVAIIGRSGSGKSTLLNLLGLIDRPTTGEIRLEGVATTGMTDRELAALRAGRVGFVFQAFHLLAYRSAVENVAMGMLYTGTPVGQRVDLARRALERVGLANRADASPATLSGGERQRVAIARAVAPSPSLLLCDEPTGNLDSGSASAVLELVESLRSDGVSVVTVTHDPTVAARAGRIIELADGQVVSDGPTAPLIEESS